MSACPATTLLGPELRAQLDAAPDGAYEVELACQCDLESGHPGPHHSVGLSGETSGDREVWLVWDGDENVPDLVEKRSCTAYRRDPEGACLLFEGHPGLHAYAG